MKRFGNYWERSKNLGIKDPIRSPCIRVYQLINVFFFVIIMSHCPFEGKKMVG